MEIHHTSDIHQNITNGVIYVSNWDIGKPIIQRQLVIARIREIQIYDNSLQKLMMTLLMVIYLAMEAINLLHVYKYQNPNLLI